MFDRKSEDMSCPNTFLGRHKFEPRYDYTLPEGLKIGGFEVKVFPGTDPMAPFKNKTYVCDVCVHCGKIVKPLP